MDYSFFQNFVVALVLSVMVGLEREQKYQTNNLDTFGGVRTFALIGLVGAVSYVISSFSVILSAVLFAGFLILVVSSYVMAIRIHNSVGGTSAVAAMLVYLIGFLSAMGSHVLATSIALVLLTALHFKSALHGWAKQLRDVEIISTIQFILIAFVILPLLPNQVFGPYDFFNPYVVWLMVVFISGVSYLSYIAIRLFGQTKGIFLTGFLAGFISSTALALSFSAQSKQNKKVVNPYVIAVVVASSAMFFRILLEVLVLNIQLFYFILVPMFVMGVVGILASVDFWLIREESSVKIKDEVFEVKSPINIVSALKFGAFFALIILVSKFLNSTMGARGVYLTSIFSSVLDVDAITVSMANLANKSLSLSTAGYAVILAAITNTFVKGGIFLFLGNRKVAVKILSVFSLMIICGLISFAVLY